MIDIPGIYVGRFKDNPNQSPILMKNSDTPTYTDDNWANVESTGTIWRYSSGRTKRDRLGCQMWWTWRHRKRRR